MCLQASRDVDLSAYNGWYLHTQRAERVSAFIGLYQGDEHEFAFLLLSRAENLSASVGLYQELSVCLHVSAHIESWACTFIQCRQIFRSTACFSFLRLHVSRAELVSSCVGLYQELSVSANVYAC
jgi:hypothetical protein